MSDQFVVNRLRREPVTYTLQISHVAVNGEWTMQADVDGVSLETEEDRRRVAGDLRMAAEWIDGGGHVRRGE